MEAVEELLLFVGSIIALLVGLTYFVSVSSSLSTSFLGQATSLQIATQFHLNTPILYNSNLMSITNFGSPIRLFTNISVVGVPSITMSNSVLYTSGTTTLTLPTTNSPEVNYVVSLYSGNRNLLASYYVVDFQDNIVSLTNVAPSTVLLLGGLPINYSITNNQANFELPDGTYNVTAYSSYYFTTNTIAFGGSTNLNISLPNLQTTHTITVNQKLPDGTLSPLALAVVNVNHNSSVVKTNATGEASFEYAGNLVYLNVSCPINVCAGSVVNQESNNYTSVEKQGNLSAISSVTLIPKFETNINLKVLTKTTTTQQGYVVPITITNSQTTATGTYQQFINISESNYVSYMVYNGNTANFYFNYPNGTLIPTWIRSNDSGKLVIFAKLNNIPASSSTTVDLVFLNKSINTLSSSGTSGIGEAPQLSPTYAEYDDGANVFNYYWNFAGTTTPVGWNIGLSHINNSLYYAPSSFMEYVPTQPIKTPFILDSYLRVGVNPNGQGNPAGQTIWAFYPPK